MDDSLDQETQEQAFHRIENCELEVPRPVGLVIFGASGDLAKRKLFPSLFRLYRHGMLAERFFILGTGRNASSTDQFRTSLFPVVKAALLDDFDQETWDRFALHIYYSALDYADQQSYTTQLAAVLPDLEKKHRTAGNRIFYLAV